MQAMQHLRRPSSGSRDKPPFFLFPACLCSRPPASHLNHHLTTSALKLASSLADRYRLIRQHRVCQLLFRPLFGICFGGCLLGFFLGSCFALPVHPSSYLKPCCHTRPPFQSRSSISSTLAVSLRAPVSLLALDSADTTQHDDTL